MDQSRRVTLYSVALAGAFLLLVSMSVGAWRWAASPVGDAPRAGASTSVLIPWVPLALLGLIAWAAAWFSANRHARPLTMAGAAERRAQPRKAYLALVQLGALLVAGLLLWQGIRLVVLYLLGGSEAVANWPATAVALGAGALLAAAVWGYHEYEVSRDEDIGMERSGAARWRRGYVYAVIMTGSALTIVGAGELLRASIRLALRPLASDSSWHAPAAGALAALLVGILLGTLGWGRANRAMTKAPALEANAPSRVVLRHAGVLFGSLVTLLSLGYLINQVLLRGVTRGGAVVSSPALFGLFDWTWALAYLPVGAIVWISASRGVRTDAETGGETRRTGTIRRFVRYLVAAVALGAFWYGLIEFARLILQVLLGAAAPGEPAATGWLERFAIAAALLLVGAPAWWGFWWSQHVRAREPGAHGRIERASMIRRAYLVLIMLVGGVLVVAAAGFGAFLALNWQAAGELGGVRAAVAGAIAAAVVSLFWAVTHGLALRGDAKRLAADTAGSPPIVTAPRTATPARAEPVGVPAVAAPAAILAPPEPPPSGARHYSRAELSGLAAPTTAVEPSETGPSIVVVDGADGGMGVALIDGLRNAVQNARIWPIGLNPSAEAAMVAAMGEAAPGELPSDLLTRASVILLPSDALAGGELTPDAAAELSVAVTGSPAHVLLMPPRGSRFHWVAAPDWPRERWVENAVVEVVNLMDRAA